MAERIQPVGRVAMAKPGEESVVDNVASETAVVPAPATPATELAGGAGKGTYDTACFACHGTGVAGAPKLGDAAAWSARIAQGMEAMLANAIKGKGGMPPKGGRMDLSDDAVKAAVEYMVEQSQ